MSSPPSDTRRVVLVDARDNALGEAAIVPCHALPGRKHRAFTALVLDADGRIVLAQRAPGKMLWHGSWDGTVASHPRAGESYVAAGEKRLVEELGVRCSLIECGRFDYRARFGDVGAEHEVCCTLVGRLDAGARLAPDPAEIAAIRRPTAAELLVRVRERPDELCPWLFLALLSLRGATLPAGLAEPLAPLLAPGVDAELRVAAERHMPAGDWTLLDR